MEPIRVGISEAESSGLPHPRQNRPSGTSWSQDGQRGIDPSKLALPKGHFLPPGGGILPPCDAENESALRVD